MLHELAETIRQRALIVIISDLFVEPELLRGCFQHLRFRKHDVAVFHLLDPQELSFDFRRPMRFLDMEGGPSIFAEPNEIADRYHKALGGYLDELQQVVLESAVDYHRVIDRRELRAGADAVPGRPDAGEGGAMSFLQPMLLAALAAGRPADHHSPDQPAAVPDDSLGGDDVPAGGQPDVARLCPAAAVADHGVAHGGDRRPGLRRQPAAGQRLAGPGGRRPGRHDDHPARPLAQHAAGGRRRRRLEARDRAPAARRRRSRRLGSARWVLIDSTTNQPARARVARRRCCNSPSAGADQRVGRPARDAAGRARLHPGQQVRAGPRSGSAPTSARTTGTPTAAAGRRSATAFCELPQGVRFHLLAYPQTAPDNLSVRVTDVRRQQTADGGGAAGLASLSREGGSARRGNRSPCSSRSMGPGPR